jgi:hypothetical protein
VILSILLRLAEHRGYKVVSPSLLAIGVVHTADLLLPCCLHLVQAGERPICNNPARD